MNVIFIGEDFYNKSHTRMASTYKIENGELERFCWADIHNAIKEGRTINIRPANDAEMLWAYKKLAEINQNK